VQWQLAKWCIWLLHQLGIIVSAVDVVKKTLVNPLSKKAPGVSLALRYNDWDCKSTVEFEHVPEHYYIDAQKAVAFTLMSLSILAGADRVQRKKHLGRIIYSLMVEYLISPCRKLDDCGCAVWARSHLQASRDGYLMGFMAVEDRCSVWMYRLRKAFLRST